MVNDPFNTTRRAVILGAGAAAILAASKGAFAVRQEIQMDKFTTRDNVTIYYKDWGPRDGKVVILSHGWPLNADSWESQAFHLAANGCRVIAHDRRGHGRSSQPWDGNDMDHYADDLAQLIERLDLRNVSLFGFSTGGGEVARYVGRHGTSRVARIGLISAVPPIMVRTASNPTGLPLEVFDGFRAASIANRSKLYRDIASGPFFGFNRPGATLDQALVENFWLQGMTAGHKNTYDCIGAFSATDFTRDLAALRQADARYPRRRRSGGADRCVGARGEAPRADSPARDLCGRSARHHRHSQGAPQQRPSDLHQIMSWKPAGTAEPHACITP